MLGVEHNWFSLWFHEDNNTQWFIHFELSGCSQFREFETSCWNPRFCRQSFEMPWELSGMHGPSFMHKMCGKLLHFEWIVCRKLWGREISFQWRLHEYSFNSPVAKKLKLTSVDCIPNCKTCADGVTCSACNETYILALNSSQCGTGCETGQFVSLAKKCQPCFQNCDNCTNSTSCTKCSSTYYLLGETSCTQNCGTSRYKGADQTCKGKSPTKVRTTHPL